jgi:hypothetical protein
VTFSIVVVAGIVAQVFIAIRALDEKPLTTREGDPQSSESRTYREAWISAGIIPLETFSCEIFAGEFSSPSQ